MKSSGANHVTLWRWENGISNNNDNNSTGIAAPSTIQGEYLINPPTTTTNATTTSDTNATAHAEQG